MRHMLFLCFLAVALPAQAEQMRVECPSAVGIGLPFHVRVEADAPMDRLRVEWADRKMTIPGNGETRVDFLLGTDVLKSRPGTYRLRVTRPGSASLPAESVIAVEDRDFPEQRLTVAKNMATPPPAAQERIAREHKQIRKVLGAVSEVNHLVLPLARPVPGDVTSAYGLRRFFNGQPRNPHRGLDLRAAEGDPVLSAAPGRVVLAADHYYAGRCVYVDHGLGVHTVYMHLSEILVREGDMVEAGQLVGKVGMTGRVTGPHLHFGLSILDLSVDPSSLFFQAEQ